MNNESGSGSLARKAGIGIYAAYAAGALLPGAFSYEFSSLIHLSSRLGSAFARFDLLGVLEVLWHCVRTPHFLWLIGLAAAHVTLQRPLADPIAGHLKHQVRIGVKLVAAGVIAEALIWARWADIALVVLIASGVIWGLWASGRGLMRLLKSQPPA